MEKVTVEIDLPMDCEKCIFSYYTEGCYSNYCKLNGRDFAREELYSDERPKWCPLEKLRNKGG